MSDSILHIHTRMLTPADLDEIRRLIADHPDWHRTRLSKELCRLWNWRDATGRIKDMACRTMLRKLDQRGLIQLPPSRAAGVRRRIGRSFQPVPHDTSPVRGDLKAIRPISLTVVERGGPLADLWRTFLHRYHYLGFRTRVGKNIAYLAHDVRGLPVAALLFGAAAWKTAPRDAFIGWTAEERQRGLELIVNNMRFLIPPWVQVPHLASHVLALAMRRIGADWERRYGHPLALAETFVDLSRFRGTCYQAANWLYVGNTTGRTRNDRYNRIRTTIKAVYVYPLRRDFRRLLRQGIRQERSDPP